MTVTIALSPSYVRGGMKCVRCVAAIPSSAEETEEMASVFLPSDDDECFPNMSDVGGGGGGRGSRAEDVGVLLR